MLPGNDESADIQITFHKDGTESLRVQIYICLLAFLKSSWWIFFLIYATKVNVKNKAANFCNNYVIMCAWYSKNRRIDTWFLLLCIHKKRLEWTMLYFIFMLSYKKWLIKNRCGKRVGFNHERNVYFYL